MEPQRSADNFIQLNNLGLGEEDFQILQKKNLVYYY